MINEQEMDRGMMTLKIIWSALLASLGIYLVIGRMVAPSMPPAVGSETLGMLRIAIYLLAFATLIASPVMPRYTSAVIASLALCESVGIYGLVLFLLGKDITDFYLLLGISAAAMIYHRPKKEELDRLYQGN